VDYPDAPVTDVLINYGSGAVGRSIFGNDKLKVWVILGENAFDRFPDIGFPVINGQQYTDQRLQTNHYLSL
jgi:hypothetical protein